MIDLISVTFQVKDVLDVSFTLGGRIDPLDISRLIPGGVIHVDRAGGYYKIDLWLKNLVMHGLSQLHMEKVCSYFLRMGVHNFCYILRWKSLEAVI